MMSPYPPTFAWNSRNSSFQWFAAVAVERADMLFDDLIFGRKAAYDGVIRTPDAGSAASGPADRIVM